MPVTGVSGNGHYVEIVKLQGGPVTCWYGECDCGWTERDRGWLKRDHAVQRAREHVNTHKPAGRV